jgi:hypothetical protein
MVKKVAGVLVSVAPVALFPFSAHAALPTGVQTALDSLEADAGSMATIVLLAIIAVFAIKLLRKGI